MKIRNSEITSWIALLGCLIIPVGLQAQECSNADFHGRYASLARLSILAPDAQQNNWIAGTLVADGNGNITEWKDTFVVVPPGAPTPVVQERDIVAAAAVVGKTPTYAVTSDCRMTVTLPTPDFDVVIVGALASGGKEFFNIQTSPDTAVVGGVFKAFDTPEEDMVRDIRMLLRRLSRRLGIFLD